ncbi:MAG: hypothetical protein K6360_07570, partial [Deltaproteobacteria bacterium]
GVKERVSKRRISMDDKRPKIQLLLAFADEGRGEALKSNREGTESPRRNERLKTRRPRIT